MRFLSVFFFSSLLTPKMPECVSRDDFEVRRCAAVWMRGHDSPCHQHEIRGVAWPPLRYLVCVRTHAGVCVCVLFSSVTVAAARLPARLPARSHSQLFISMPPLISPALLRRPKWARRLINVRAFQCLQMALGVSPPCSICSFLFELGVSISRFDVC